MGRQSKANTPVCFPTVCDPHLLTIDDIFVSFLLSLGFYTGHVRACARLGYTVSLEEKKMPNIEE